MVRTTANPLTSISGKCSASNETAAIKVLPRVTTSSTTVMLAGTASCGSMAIVSKCVSGPGRSPGAAIADFGTATSRRSNRSTYGAAPCCCNELQIRSAGHSWPSSKGALRGVGTKVVFSAKNDASTPPSFAFLTTNSAARATTSSLPSLMR